MRHPRGTTGCGGCQPRGSFLPPGGWNPSNSKSHGKGAWVIRRAFFSTCRAQFTMNSFIPSELKLTCEVLLQSGTGKRKNRGECRFLVTVVRWSPSQTAEDSQTARCCMSRHDGALPRRLLVDPAKELHGSVVEVQMERRSASPAPLRRLRAPFANIRRSVCNH